ncbi:hypothetical protein O9A_00242 [Bartonella koehlerae C-29]|uniref:Uncharacterized protein n=1 Tax=Bartonella koehlerae C-29 TaxID=1134510 RepID=A0A067WJE2_9HYPH|nr:hypothetical protein O9A_00242 [Bartonella koehlerae C-29]
MLLILDVKAFLKKARKNKGLFIKLCLFFLEIYKKFFHFQLSTAIKKMKNCLDVGKGSDTNGYDHEVSPVSLSMVIFGALGYRMS